MAKELKNFEVWHPPKEVDEPLIEESKNLFGKRQSYPTKTGLIWLLVPWLLLFKKRLNYSLMEFWLVGIIWGGCSGLVASGLILQKARPLSIAIILYFVFHSFCLMFTAALYNLKLWKNYSENASPKRWTLIGLYVMVPTVFWVVLGIMLNTLEWL